MREVEAISKKTLDFILEISESAYPKEMAGMLTTRDKIINNVILAPGTYTSETSAVMRIDQLPVGLRTVGSVHSHPSNNATPSKADLEMFSKNGNFHIITKNPYGENDWVCYNRKGETIDLKVKEIEEKEDDLWEKELKRVKEELNE